MIQTVISKIALENQLARLGFFIPPVKLTNELNKCVSILWADNGDAISQQYAGTDALKGIQALFLLLIIFQFFLINFFNF